MCRGHDRVLLLGNQRGALGDPRIGDGLTRLPLQVTEHGGDGDPGARHDRGGVRVDQRGQLVPVPAAEWAYLD